MRQRFDVGDLVKVTFPDGGNGIVIETSPINKSVNYPENAPWHPDEYKCKVAFVNTSTVRWIRAKWLEHLSKIGE